MVHTGSKKERIEKREDVIHVWVVSPPTDGRANNDVIRLLALYFDIAPSRVVIACGLGSKKPSKK
jgi:uncharacterized protein